MITDNEFFMLYLWLGLLGGGFYFRKPPITVIGSLFGIWFGFQLATEASLYPLLLICINLYTVYVAFSNWDQA